jgi:hypothetical protein
MDASSNPSTSGSNGIMGGFRQNQQQMPLSLSGTAQALRSTAQNALQTAAQGNPGMQRVINGYESWEASLRNEASKRLVHGITPPLLTDGDWELLKRVPGTIGQGLGNMKRSASENTLSLPTVARKQGSQAPGYGFQAEADLFGMRMAPMRPPRTGPFGMPKGARQPGPAGMAGSSTALQPSEQHMLRLGIPMVPSAPNLHALSETVSTEAAKNIEAFLSNGRKAIENAQQSIQQTAANCQQNLQTLSTMVQLNVANKAKEQQQQWQQQLATTSDPFTGTLVPWSVFPRVLQAREQEAAAASALARPGGSNDQLALAGDPSPSPGGTQDWTAPFDQFMQHLDHGAASSSSPQAAGRRPPVAPGARVGDPGRQVAIVTTASLPWLTGTSVNPLLRAAYLSNDGNRKVTLCLPWLSKQDQEKLFPPNAPRFETPEAQEDYIRDWARKRTGLSCDFRISFYPGRYAAEKGEKRGASGGGKGSGGGEEGGASKGNPHLALAQLSLVLMEACAFAPPCS